MYNFQDSLFNYRENEMGAKKKKYKYRFNEIWVRYHGFKNNYFSLCHKSTYCRVNTSTNNKS